MTISEDILLDLRAALGGLEADGLLKTERAIEGGQGTHIAVDGAPVINFCANNYLGLANHPDVVAAAHSALDEWGFGMASVRFISGTQSLHLALERELSTHLSTEATILFPSCFDANGAVFEVLLDENDAVISDALNHASIIDGIRLSKARRLRYANRDLADLESRLIEASGARRRLIVTDGVFSMDGYLAPLDEICALAERYNAMVMVDDSHAVGFVGPTGAGTPELFGVSGRVDILTGTLGKALGGASGGYVSGRTEIVELLRQRGRPYLFSNAVAPSNVAGAREALRIAASGSERRDTLAANAVRFRAGMSDAGFDLLDGSHPIVPVMFRDEATAVRMARELFALGVYATAFAYPVVPLGRARIRVQLSSAHTAADIDAAIAAFVTAREKLRVKLYLASHDRHGLAPELGALVGDNRRVAIIANANDGDSPAWRQAAVDGEIISLARIGLAGEELDLRDYFAGAGDLAADLAGFGLVWARGGNAFLLSRAMRDSGMLRVLPPLLRETGLAYGGYSAGAVLAGPTLRGIELVDDERELPAPYTGPTQWRGLDLVPYSIAPHYRSAHRDVDKIDRVVEYLQLNGMPYRGLADLQTIVIDGDDEHLLDRRTGADRALLP